MSLKRKKRFFLSLSDIGKDFFFIKDKEFHHLKNVLRLKDGDKVYGISEKGCEYFGEITHMDSEKATCKIISCEEKIAKSACEYSIMQSVIKESNMSIILEKMTELGVANFIPLISSRSSFPNSCDKAKKLERWNKIIHNSAKQCGNLHLTKLHDFVCIGKVMDFDFKAYDAILLLSTQAELSLKESLQKISSCPEKSNLKILVIIGPEGGFSLEEETLFLEHGACAISCADHVLRSETAALYMSSVLCFWGRG